MLRKPHTGRSRRDKPAIDPATIQIALQPIAEIATGRLVAAEALARFSAPSAGTAELFQQARAEGWGTDLEAACLRRALAKRDEIPDGVLLSVNLSPDALTHPHVQQTLAGDLTGLIVEITEQRASDPHALDALLAELRSRGALIAVDDLSTGYAGLLRLTTLRPDIIKLDRSLVTGLADNPDHAAIICALAAIARWIDARLIAEGVEALPDLIALAELDIDYAQGWALARPADELPEIDPHAVNAARTARRAQLRQAANSATPHRAHSVIAATAALAATSDLAEVQHILSTTAHSIGVDRISISLLTDDHHLHEITATQDKPDPHRYRLDDYPATLSALRTGTMLEAHTDDPHTDPAERAALAMTGHASLLLTPLATARDRLGVLEFSHRTTLRWTSHHLRQARILADHLTPILARQHGAPDKSVRGCPTTTRPGPTKGDQATARYAPADPHEPTEPVRRPAKGYSPTP